MPIVEAWERFQRPTRYGELLVIENRIQEMHPKAIIFRFELYPETDRDLKFLAFAIRRFSSVAEYRHKPWR